MRSNRSFPLLAGLLLLVPLASASAQTADEPRGDDRPRRVPLLGVDDVPGEALDDVALLLSGVHGAPDRALLEARVPGAREVLMAVALDAEALPQRRPQAVWALAQWDDDDVLAALGGVLAEASFAGDGRLVHHALLALGASFGDRATKLVTPFLENDDVQVRLSAIAALGEIDSDRSAAALEGALQREPSRVARERIAEALQRVR